MPARGRIIAVLNRGRKTYRPAAGDTSFSLAPLRINAVAPPTLDLSVTPYGKALPTKRSNNNERRCACMNSAPQLIAIAVCVAPFGGVACIRAA
jgi:hypothetical protein